MTYPTDDEIDNWRERSDHLQTCRHCGFERKAHRLIEGGVLLCVPIVQGSRSFVAGPTYEQLKQRVVELEAALSPFADWADTWPATVAPFEIDGKQYTDAYDFGCRWVHGTGDQISMKLGHYRTARRLLGRLAARSEYEGAPGDGFCSCGERLDVPHHHGDL